MLQLNFYVMLQEIVQLLADQAPLEIGVLVWDAVLPPQYEVAFTRSKVPGITELSSTYMVNLKVRTRIHALLFNDVFSQS